MKKSLFATDGTYAKIMNWIWDVIVISVLWVICSIPIITAGAATSAAYYAAAKAVRAGEGKAFSAFFHAFRQNFKQTAFFSVLYCLILLVLLFDSVYCYNNAQIPLIVLYLFYCMILLSIVSAQYLFTFISRFSLSKFQLFRMAVLCSFRHIISTILLLVLLVAMAVGVYLMPWGVLAFPGIMFYLTSYVMEPVMRKYMASPKPGEEDKWYYFNKKSGDENAA